MFDYTQGRSIARRTHCTSHTYIQMAPHTQLIHTDSNSHTHTHPTHRSHSIHSVVLLMAYGTGLQVVVIVAQIVQILQKRTHHLIRVKIRPDQSVPVCLC